ncbi:polysaccharide deacetylase family protein [Tessaracoccus caeni]|uniref:polysaccharide deacetylase family protein n=1 Tax=Tessaracoccus caeni TaxID=3031239 RepID=UPI0023DAD2E8|nr:polysaccharide deacetylase family protein [Tessaracoccus caeni]MDF1489329.1 polysaccharide deacetylase [Tessaracoccus caeni]
MGSSRRVAIAGLSIVALLAGACAPVELSARPSTSPRQSSSPSASATQTSTPSPSPSPSSSPSQSATSTPSPTPTHLPTELMPGTNHNYAAEAYAYPAKLVQKWLRGKKEADEKVVFLTFDDGPNHSITPEILDILAEEKVPATFFLVGSEIEDAPNMLERQIAEGHAIALHSYTHDYSKLYPGRYADAARVAKEFDDTLAEVRAVLGEDFSTGAWRYPGGHMSWKSMEGADKALKKRGASWIDWNCMTGDAEPASRRPTTVSGMLSMATDPIDDDVKVAVVLAHDSIGKDLTVKSLRKIIKAYKEAGYTFGVIS